MYFHHIHNYLILNILNRLSLIGVPTYYISNLSMVVRLSIYIMQNLQSQTTLLNSIELQIIYQGYPIVLQVYPENTFHSIIQLLQKTGYFPQLTKEKIKIINLNPKSKGSIIFTRQNIFQLHRQFCEPGQPFIAQINWSTKHYHITLSYHQNSVEVQRVIGNRTYISHLIRYFKLIHQLDHDIQLKAVVNGKIVQKQDLAIEQIIESNTKKISITMLNIQNIPLYRMQQPRYSYQKQIILDENDLPKINKQSTDKIVQRYAQSILQLDDLQFHLSDISDATRNTSLIKRYDQSKIYFGNIQDSCQDIIKDFDNTDTTQPVIQRYKQSQINLNTQDSAHDNLKDSEITGDTFVIKRYKQSQIYFDDIQNSGSNTYRNTSRDQLNRYESNIISQLSSSYNEGKDTNCDKYSQILKKPNQFAKKSGPHFKSKKLKHKNQSLCELF